MIVNFAGDVDNLYVFLEEGDVVELEEDTVSGPVLDSDRPHFRPGSFDLLYDEDAQFVRPQIGREVSDDGFVDDFEVVVSDSTYSSLLENEVYHGRVGSYQDLSSAGKVWVFPPENRGQYDYLFDDLEFYQGLTEEQRQNYEESLS